MELYKIQNALETLNTIHEQGRIDYGEYSCIFDALSSAEEACLSQYNAEAAAGPHLVVDGCVDLEGVFAESLDEWKCKIRQIQWKGEQS